MAVAASAAAGGCQSTSEAGFLPLPDLATQSPSKQPVLTPAEQKKAIDDLVAKRNQQATEAEYAADPEAAKAKAAKAKAAKAKADAVKSDAVKSDAVK